MSQLNRFYAASAIYFGLASAVTAQQGAEQPAVGATVETEESKQQKFRHPLVDPQPSTDLRPDADAQRRIQRRGLDDVRQDGQMRRKVAPNAARSDPNLLSPERRSSEHRVPGR